MSLWPQALPRIVAVSGGTDVLGPSQVRHSRAHRTDDRLTHDQKTASQKLTVFLCRIIVYCTGFSVIRRSFGSKNVMVNGYTLPSLSLLRSSSSEANSEMCTNPATPSSIEASAPCLLCLMTTASTCWSL